MGSVKNCDYLISYDKELAQFGKELGIPVVTPKEFLREVWIPESLSIVIGDSEISELDNNICNNDGKNIRCLETDAAIGIL